MKNTSFVNIRKFVSVVSASVGLEENIYREVSNHYDEFIFTLFFYSKFTAFILVFIKPSLEFVIF